MRDITRADLEKWKAELPGKFLTDNYLDDGAGKLVLKINDAYWTIFVEDDTGAPEVGDRGEIRYDPHGRWLQMTPNGPPALSIGWSVTEDTLMLQDVVGVNGHAAGADERFVLSGKWKRQV